MTQSQLYSILTLWQHYKAQFNFVQFQDNVPVTASYANNLQTFYTSSNFKVSYACLVIQAFCVFPHVTRTQQKSQNCYSHKWQLTILLIFCGSDVGAAGAGLLFPPSSDVRFYNMQNANHHTGIYNKDDKMQVRKLWILSPFDCSDKHSDVTYIFHVFFQIRNNECIRHH